MRARIRNRRRVIFEWAVPAAAIMLLVLAAPVWAPAAPPWEALIPFQKIDADPKNPYWLTDEQGPWLILAASFAGEGADTQAHDLAIELRKKFKLHAYVDKRRFDLSGKEQGLGIDRYGRPKQMRHRQAAVFDEYAVLVGNFDSVDDPRAEKALDKIKHISPETLKIGPDKSSTQRFAGLRYFYSQKNRDPDKRSMGPMRNAFITVNPRIPKEYFAPKGLDPLVVAMNESVEHSLLSCPGRYTVKVATFRGKVVWDLETDAYRKVVDSKVSDKLEEAALKAHKVTEALRERGIEAYEFHDRNESIVTVGSFNSVGTPRADGKIEIDPHLHQVMEAFAAVPRDVEVERVSVPSAMLPRVVAGVALDVQPVPVVVPRVSIATDYAGGNRILR
jgi:hypothetical protein